MKDYERLTDEKEHYKKCVGCSYRNCQYCEDKYEYAREVHNRLAELEDKIEQGTLKEFDDNLIGETVYGIQQDITGKYYFYGYENTLLGFTANGIVTWNDIHGYNDYFNDELWFLTREEAERRLKELQE